MTTAEWARAFLPIARRAPFNYIAIIGRSCRPLALAAGLDGTPLHWALVDVLRA